MMQIDTCPACSPAGQTSAARLLGRRALLTQACRLQLAAALLTGVLCRWLTPRDQVALTFGGLQEAGVGVELDGQPPRLVGTPFAADLDPGQCYRVFPGGQVLLPSPP